MMGEFNLSVDALIKDELDGKASAIARYDEIIWKIRTGYAVILYGAVGILAGLVNQKAINLVLATVLSATILVVGFSVFGALMDYSFVRAKLRVVEYRDRLVKLAYLRAVAGSMNATQNEELMECLKNAGERKEPVIWTQRVGRSVPLIYYGGTAAVCACAIRVLVT